MKTCVLALFLGLVPATATLAGGPVVVAADPVIMAPAPAAVYDWTGPYVGLGFGVTSGRVAYTPGGAFNLNDGNATSLFAGYLMQSGAWVYGGELAYSRANKTHAVGFPNENARRIVDLKGKLGYAANRALFYGVLGYSSVNYNIPGAGGGNFTTSGVAYGLGMDFAVSNNVTVGVEYLARKTKGNTYIAGQTAKLDVNTFSVRVAYKF